MTDIRGNERGNEGNERENRMTDIRGNKRGNKGNERENRMRGEMRGMKGKTECNGDKRIGINNYN